MTRKSKFRNPEAVYFVTFTTVNWIDVFTLPIYKEGNNCLTLNLAGNSKKVSYKLHWFSVQVTASLKLELSSV